MADSTDGSSPANSEGDPLPPRCGYPWKGGFHGGCGCGKPFTAWREVFRCADCGIPMHQRCLIEHFGDGKERDVEGHGRVRSPVHTHHVFALQIAWLVEEVMKRDTEIKQLKAHRHPEVGNPGPLLTINEVIRKLKVSKSTFDRMRRGLYPVVFPKPIYMGESPRWTTESVNVWVKDMEMKLKT